ncbi:cytochrome B [Mucilaginibacter pocheonensis]|uniref:Threonine/homoserine/homoserine lactone efflux protein n=1 Tax=Mucilaginibacter pocheonensis TaxID=398050 RepID=A0ABU1T8Z2_9SPHI|nr:cytochrome B [Mucilaginibacter pocheonensis]MDR6941871.1 threonine/homoserine/homoserine lactone efflux protein [Mucilaginibacter pocheonensis]
MTLYSFFQQLHSGFRYIVLIFVVLAALNALAGLISKKPYTEVNRRLSLFALISVHTQLLIGIVLYFISPLVQFTKNAMHEKHLRFFTVEHWVIMVIAIVLITIGHSKSKRAVSAEAKQKAISIFYLLGLIIIAAGILLIPRG